MQMSMTSTMAHHENSCSLFLISYDLFCPLSFWRPTISGPQVKATTSRKPRGKLPQGSTKVMATCCRFWMILAHFHHSHPSGFGSGCSNDLLLSRPYSQYLRGGSVLGPPPFPTACTYSFYQCLGCLGCLGYLSYLNWFQHLDHLARPTVNSHRIYQRRVTAFITFVPSRKDEDLCSFAEVEEDTEASCKGWPCWSAAIGLPESAEEMRRETS